MSGGITYGQAYYLLISISISYLLLYCAHWIDRPLVKGNEDLGTRVLANVMNRNSVFVWSTESKPGRPHRIRVEANIKYAFLAYQDTCGCTLGF